MENDHFTSKGVIAITEYLQMIVSGVYTQGDTDTECKDGDLYVYLCVSMSVCHDIIYNSLEP